MTDRHNLRDKIARALSTQTTCDGEPFPSELHYRLADAVLAVIDLNKVRAEAFEQGVRSAVDAVNKIGSYKSPLRPYLRRSGSEG